MVVSIAQATQIFGGLPGHQVGNYIGFQQLCERITEKELCGIEKPPYNFIIGKWTLIEAE